MKVEKEKLTVYRPEITEDQRTALVSALANVKRTDEYGDALELSDNGRAALEDLRQGLLNA